MLPVTFPSSQAFDSELSERFYSRLIYKRNLTQRNKNVLCLKSMYVAFLSFRHWSKKRFVIYNKSAHSFTDLSFIDWSFIDK
jgi:hypothetical protein